MPLLFRFSSFPFESAFLFLPSRSLAVQSTSHPLASFIIAFLTSKGPDIWKRTLATILSYCLFPVRIETDLVFVSLPTSSFTILVWKRRHGGCDSLRRMPLNSLPSRSCLCLSAETDMPPSPLFFHILSLILFFLWFLPLYPLNERRFRAVLWLDFSE